MAVERLGKYPPEILRRFVIGALSRSLCKATGVDEVRARHGNAEERLGAFRDQTLQAARRALEGEEMAIRMRGRLFREAHRLGSLVRFVAFAGNDARAFAILRLLYRCIGIEIEQLDDESGAWSGIKMRSCSFSQAYDAQVCTFMGAFDSGFCHGLTKGRGLSFCERLTQGAPCCRANLVVGGGECDA